ncbi:MAG: mechanosensitive ion channel family protein [Myxococcota bacterium]
MELGIEQLGGREWPLEVAGLLLVLLLAIAIRVFAPRRVGLKMIAALVLTHGIALGLHFLARKASAQTLFTGVALVSLVLAAGRGLFLLLFDVIVARRHPDSFPRILRDVTQVVVLFFGGLWSLRALNVETNHLLTTSAFVTLVVGLGLQETLGNVIAGLSLQIERPFEVGDIIEIHGSPSHVGKVREVNWRATRIHTLDNVDVVIPNGHIAKAMVTNFDRPHANPRRTIVFSAPYEVSPLAVEAAALEAIADMPDVVGEAKLTLERFADSGIDYALRYFISDTMRGQQVDGEARVRLWHSFARAGIAFPYPVRVVEQKPALDPAAIAASEAAARAKALEAIDLLAPLGAAGVAELARQVRTLTYAPKETVVRSGEAGSTMFVVERGALSVWQGNERIAELGRGAFFGEMSLLTGEARSATVRCETECVLYLIDHQAFSDVLHQNTEIARAISQKVSERGARRPKTEAQAAATPAVTQADLLERILRFFR